MNMMVQDPGVCVREPRAGASVWIRGSPGGGDAWSGVGLHRNRRGRGKPCWRAIRLEHLDFLFKVVTVLSEVLCSNQMYTFKLRLTLRFFFLGCSRAMAPHSSTLAWRIPWTEEPGGLKSTGSLRVGHDRVTSLSLFTFMHWRRKWQPTPVFLPGESRDGGAWWAAVCGVTESDTTEAT